MPRILWYCPLHSYAARPDALVLDHLSLTIPAGTKLALIGSSGCGKTTCALMLLKLYQPQTGHLLLDGHDIATLNTEWLRGRIGYVSQEPILFQGTIYDNIRYGTDADMVQVWRVFRSGSCVGSCCHEQCISDVVHDLKKHQQIPQNTLHCCSFAHKKNRTQHRTKHNTKTQHQKWHQIRHQTQRWIHGGVLSRGVNPA